MKRTCFSMSSFFWFAHAEAPPSPSCIIMHFWQCSSAHIYLTKNAAISSANKIWFFGQ